MCALQEMVTKMHGVRHLRHNLYHLNSFTEMITDRYLDFQFETALLLLEHTRSTLADALSDEATALLDKIEAHVR